MANFFRKQIFRERFYSEVSFGCGGWCAACNSGFTVITPGKVSERSVGESLTDDLALFLRAFGVAQFVSKTDLLDRRFELAVRVF